MQRDSPFVMEEATGRSRLDLLCEGNSSGSVTQVRKRSLVAWLQVQLSQLHLVGTS